MRCQDWVLFIWVPDRELLTLCRLQLRLVMSGCVQRYLNLGGTPLLQEQPLQAVIAAAQEHNKPKLGAFAANFQSGVLALKGTDTAGQRPSMSVPRRADEPAFLPATELIGCCLGPHYSQPMAWALRIMASNILQSAVAQGAGALHENWVRSLLDCLYYHA